MIEEKGKLKTSSLMKKAVKEVLRNEVMNTAVRVPVKTLLAPFSHNRRMKSFMLRIPVVGKWKMNLPNGKSLVIYSGPELDSVARRLFYLGFEDYEPETSRIFCQLAKESMTIFDVGANLGYFSLLARAANKKCHIVAFEPIPEFFRCLKVNIHMNRASNVTAVPLAVTDRDGSIVLYVNEEASSSALKDYRKVVAEIEVPAVTLDTYVKRHGIDRLDLIKIDVEASEPKVLEGMRNILRRDEPNIICEVLWGRTESFLNRFLSEYGYRFYWITENGLRRTDAIVGDEKYRYLNYLFTKHNINATP